MTSKPTAPNSASVETHSEAVFAERARRLAQPVSAFSSSNRRHALVVTVGGEQYAIEALHLVSVIPEARCAKVPGSASEIVGLLAFRSRAVPVVDLALLLGIKPGPPTVLRAVLIVRGTATRVGLAVDAINEMLELAAAIADSPDPLQEGLAKFVYKHQDGLPWIIRMNALLSHHVMKNLS